MEEKLNFKIRVASKEQSREIQKILFSLGFKWHAEGEEVCNLEMPYIYFFMEEQCMSIFYGEYEHQYLEHNNKEITLAQLKSEEFQYKIKKYFLVRSLKNG